MNWQEQLEAFRRANPDLPEGEDVAAEPREEKSVKQPPVHMRIERKGRGGKTVTIIGGWVIDADCLADVTTQLKKRLGTGGTIEDGEIVIQGDRRTQISTLLPQLGYKIKNA